MRIRGTGVVVAIAAIAMVNAASASAAALYVDDSGSDSGDCTVPSTPCKTIEFAHDQPGTDDVIHLGGGTYAESAAITDSESLIEDSAFIPAAAGAAVIDNSSVTPPNLAALTMSSTGTVSGLTIASDVTAVRIIATGTVSGNTFASDAPSGLYEADVVVDAFPGISPTITGNTFIDPNPEAVNPGQTALVLNSTGSPTVTDNTFSGFFQAISALSGSAAAPTISGNVITGTHDTTAGGTAISASGAITPIIANNSIHSPGAGTPDGIFISSAGATLQRNRVLGHDKGLVVASPTGIVTMSSDLIAKSATRGIDISGGGTFVDADNITVIDNVFTQGDIEVGTGTGLSMDSSIVGGGGGANGINGIDVEGSGACSISDSRGTGDTGISSNCDTGFVSTADPMFVNRAANDYHLAAGSAMIDMGNMVAPAPGTLDLDGDDRALAVAAQCVTPPAGRRDIGADEFVTTCPPPVTNPTPPATTPPAAKKCKKGRKLKKGKCVKKKRKKRK